MVEVRRLVEQMVNEPAPPRMLAQGQTVMLTEEARDKLQVLAKVVGNSKTRLASRLLTAAIDDAIAALPDEGNMYYESMFDATTNLHTPRKLFALLMAEHDYYSGLAEKQALHHGAVDDQEGED